jgi:hypothetical protein
VQNQRETNIQQVFVSITNVNYHQNTFIPSLLGHFFAIPNKIKYRFEHVCANCIVCNSNILLKKAKVLLQRNEEKKKTQTNEQTNQQTNRTRQYLSQTNNILVLYTECI